MLHQNFVKIVGITSFSLLNFLWIVQMVFMVNRIFRLYNNEMLKDSKCSCAYLITKVPLSIFKVTRICSLWLRIWEQVFMLVSMTCINPWIISCHFASLWTRCLNFEQLTTASCWGDGEGVIACTSYNVPSQASLRARTESRCAAPHLLTFPYLTGIAGFSMTILWHWKTFMRAPLISTWPCSCE